MTRRALPLLLLVLMAAPGCYHYGFQGQPRQLIRSPKPWEDLARIREGEDARARREAMIRLAQTAAGLKGEVWHAYSGRKQIARSVSMAHETDPMVRATAAALLRQVGTEMEAPLLARSLEGNAEAELGPEPSDFARREMVKTLGVLGTRDEIPLLRRILLGRREAVGTRVEAGYALARIGGPDAVSALVEGLSDFDESVIFACWDGLNMLTGEDLPPAETVWARWWEEHRGEFAAEDLITDREI